MKELLRLISVWLLSLGCVLPATGQTTPAPELRQVIEQVDAMAATELAATSNVGSISIGLVSGSGLVWSKSYGYADGEKKELASKETIYRVGSITTQFTALMMLQLLQAGKIHLSDPVEKYFPEVNKVQGRYPGTAPITLVQLATHSAGLASEPANQSLYTKGSVADWEKTLIAALPETKYLYEPGTRASYSNIGYAILGAALGRAANQPYVEYVEQKIFAPLGMTHTTFEPKARTSSQISKGYNLEGGRVDTATPEREHQGRGYKVPNGAVYTTIGDLSRFISFELGEGPESVLTKSALAENFKRITIMTDDYNAYLASGYGIGFRLRRQNDLVIFGHAGGVSGYEARADFDPLTRTGIVVLRNVGGKAIHVSTSKLAGIALEKLAAARRQTAAR